MICADSSLKIIRDILVGTIPTQGNDPNTTQGAEGDAQTIDKEGLPTYAEGISERLSLFNGQLCQKNAGHIINVKLWLQVCTYG